MVRRTNDLSNQMVRQEQNGKNEATVNKPSIAHQAQNALKVIQSAGKVADEAQATLDQLLHAEELRRVGQWSEAEYGHFGVVMTFLPAAAEQFASQAQHISHTCASIFVNVIFLHHEKKLGKPASYEEKKAMVRSINERLRRIDAAFEHPETGDPCLLLAVNSRDGFGRFTLQSRVDKRRSGSYQMLGDFLPLKLTPDIPRKEGVIERRKKEREEQRPKAQTRRKKPNPS